MAIRIAKKCKIPPIIIRICQWLSLNFIQKSIYNIRMTWMGGKTQLQRGRRLFTVSKVMMILMMTLKSLRMT
jgi:hypothetical protein